MINRRTDDRTLVHVPVKAIFDGGEEVDVQIEDHSFSGVRLILAIPVRLGAVGYLAIGPDQFHGTVKYCIRLEDRPGYMVGLLFP